MGDELTRDQVKRDDFLRTLALDPNEALRHWKRLKPRESIVVITYMTLAYGPASAQHFKKEADRHKRPETYYTVTNLPGDWIVRPDVQERGWPALSIWVHPTGKQIWLIQAAKAAPPPPVVPSPVQPHPDIEEIRQYVKDYLERENKLNLQARQLEGRRSKRMKSTGGGLKVSASSQKFRLNRRI